MRVLAVILIIATILPITGTSLAEQKAEQKIRITDSHGKWAFDAPPKRIAVINWTITQQLLELNVHPIAIGDIKGFAGAVPNTPVPNGIIDLGSRSAPNLQQLKQLEPELIIIGYSQRDLMRVLSNIAPVMYFNNFSRRSNNSERVEQHFLTLAKLFDKTALAKQKLLARNQTIQRLNQQINTHYQGKERPALKLVSIDESGKAWLYTSNSMPSYAAQRLGFSLSSEEKPTKLGVRQIALEDIETFTGCVLYLNSSQATLPDKTGCASQLQPVFPFGGAMSLGYLSESIAEAILAIPNSR